MGSTRLQALRKVQLPQAKRTIVVGVNQTIMASLSMVTIAALIDAPGLGQVVVRALESLDVGRSFQAGLGIIVLAVVLDRSTTAAASKVDVTGPVETHDQRKKLIFISAGLATLVLCLASRIFTWAGAFPGTGTIGSTIARDMNSFVNWFQIHFVTVTNDITDVVSYGLINPMQSLLTESPWYITGLAFVGLGAVLADGN